MDEFGYHNWLMVIGDIKGSIVDKEIEKKKPKVIVEIGGYCGYSAIRFANLQKNISPESHYFSFEYSREFASIAHSIIEFAGLSEQISIIVGSFSVTFPKVVGEIGNIDMIFIDHKKENYLPDLKLIESFIDNGTVIIADNVIYPGAPDYLQYIRNNKNYKSTFHETVVEYMKENPIKDGIEVSIYLRLGQLVYP